MAAVYGYETVEWIALHRARTLRRLRLLFPAMACDMTTAGWRAGLRTVPLNPTHSLWYELVEDCGFPFLKTDLLARNPIGIPDLVDWGELVPPEQPELRCLLEEHLRQFAKCASAPERWSRRTASRGVGCTIAPCGAVLLDSANTAAARV